MISGSVGVLRLTTGITLGSSEMTLERINQILDSDRRMYYRTHELNDKLPTQLPLPTLFWDFEVDQAGETVYRAGEKHC